MHAKQAKVVKGHIDDMNKASSTQKNDGYTYEERFFN